MTELSDQSSTPKEKEANASADDKKRKMFIGLDLGTLQSCILSKLVNLELESIMASGFQRLLGIGRWYSGGGQF